MPVAEMLRRVGSAELSEWQAEFKLRADDEQAAYDKAREEAGQP